MLASAFLTLANCCILSKQSLSIYRPRASCSPAEIPTIPHGVLSHLPGPPASPSTGTATLSSRVTELTSALSVISRILCPGSLKTYNVEAQKPDSSDLEQTFEIPKPQT